VLVQEILLLCQEAGVLALDILLLFGVLALAILLLFGVLALEILHPVGVLALEIVHPVGVLAVEILHPFGVLALDILPLCQEFGTLGAPDHCAVAPVIGFVVEPVDFVLKIEKGIAHFRLLQCSNATTAESLAGLAQKVAQASMSLRRFSNRSPRR
jgi:hypothetical protein